MPPQQSQPLHDASTRLDLLYRIVPGLVSLLLLAGLLFQVYRQPIPSVLQRVQDQGYLVVATRRAASTYYPGPNGPAGLEYELVSRFAASLGVEVRWQFPGNIQAVFNAARNGRAHLAAAGLSISASRSHNARFTAPYASITTQLVYRRGSTRPQDLGDIQPDELVIVARSIHEEQLRLQRNQAFPQLSWRGTRDRTMEQLLREVEDGTVRYTLANSNDLILNRRFYPHLKPAFDIGRARDIAWALPNYGDDSLREAADRFLNQLIESGDMEQINERYFGHSGRLNFVDKRDFWRHLDERLPLYEDYFKEAAELTGIDWRLLAAISYQESHWRNDAVSPTGVRGLMMLTKGTATMLGVEDRSDPRQSILGGSRYLRRVEDKLPKRIQGMDRLWLTLAGYNIGFGHLEDARVLTQRRGGNPDLWTDVREHLPLLADPTHFKGLKYGYARGKEPVAYVGNVRNYYDLIVWHTNQRELLSVPVTAATSDDLPRPTAQPADTTEPTTLSP